MFAYCNDNPLRFKDPSGTRLVINDPVSDFEYLRNYNKGKETGFTASIGGAVSGIAVDYNIIPKAHDSSQTYSGITLSEGLITPGFNIGMSNTVYGISLPFTVFDLAEAAYKGWLGVQ